MPFGDGEGLLISSRRLLKNFLDDFICNFGYRRRFLERNGHGIDSGKTFGSNFLSKIDFVEQNEDFFRVMGREKGFFFG